MITVYGEGRGFRVVWLLEEMDLPYRVRQVDLLSGIGLGYLSLGQSATTLSGGEAQRIKLVSELHRAPAGHSLYLLDEPTNGLHPADIDLLVGRLQALVDGLLADLAALGHVVQTGIAPTPEAAARVSGSSQVRATITSGKQKAAAARAIEVRAFISSP